eukprot:CAMPEP_0184663180 /NCGR_PEP_ID=MMETSP0308-20130426/46982_1 /TAXON_ID=38269 /ORGANISM="Gloeochaete witrockiana, Strain SAG 46.84" /LENGTH=1243 /DNA_ID=CAMNT_0027105741 /DNA_START=223 /DNA_END=3954 /DNA_ORIENTATION=+
MIVRTQSVEIDYIPPKDTPLDYGQAKKIKGAEVWVPDEKGMWEAGTVLSAEEAVCLVKTISGRKTKVPHAHLPYRNPWTDGSPGGVGYASMKDMPYLHEPGLLFNLEARFSRDIIYTYSGPALIALNPFKWLPIYSTDVIQKYKGKQQAEVAPHAFAVAEKAYRNMLRDEKSQSILVSGESGSGKTETFKILLNYLAEVSSKDGHVSQIAEKVIQTNPILESFGNAKTVRNNNSSRYGKFLDVCFSKQGEVIGANIQTYLLEKSRVVFQSPGERNFHVFYDLLAGGSALLAEFVTLKGPDQYNYLQQGNVQAGNRIDAEEFKKMIVAFETLGMSEEEIKSIFRCVAGCLYIGQVSFLPDPKQNEACKIEDNEGARSCCTLLGCSVAELEKALCYKTITTGKESFSKPLTKEQAVGSRDALAKAMFGRLFLWIGGRVNNSIKPEGPYSYMIGVLDIFGFESFETNSFEQLCINYANEKLQQLFIQNVLKTEQEEYKAEEIKFTFVQFNDNKECVAAIEKKGAILSLLDEECVVPKGTDEGFAGKVLKAVVQSYGGYVSPYKPGGAKKKFDPRTTFQLRHYAREVVYDCNGFLDKNRDTIGSDLIELVAKKLQFTFASKLFADIEPSNGGAPKSSIKGSATVGAQFKDQLAALMAKLSASALSYITCIKSTPLLIPGDFDRMLVLGQLRCAGVLEGIAVARASYPNRPALTDVVKRFEFLLSAKELAPYGSDLRTRTKAILDKLMPADSLASLKIQIGKTKLFLSTGLYEEMEAQRTRALSERAIKIQATMRRRLIRRRVALLKKSIVYLQAAARMRLARNAYLIKRPDWRRTAVAPFAAPDAPDGANMVTLRARSFKMADIDKLIDKTQSAAAAAVAVAAVAGAAGGKKVALKRGPSMIAIGKDKTDKDIMNDSVSCELHIGDLRMLLTSKAFTAMQKLTGFKHFYVLYGRHAAELTTVPGFADDDLMKALLQALADRAKITSENPDVQARQWSAAVLALLSMFVMLEANARSVVDDMGIERVIVEMKTMESDPTVQAAGCAFMSNIIKQDFAIKYLCREDGKGVKLVSKWLLSRIDNDFLTTTSSALSMARYGLMALAELVPHSSFKNASAIAKVAINRMENLPRDITVQHAASDLLRRFASMEAPMLMSMVADPRDVILKNLGVEALCKCLENWPNEAELLEKATVTLEKLGGSSGCKKRMTEIGLEKQLRGILSTYGSDPTRARLLEACRKLLRDVLKKTL